MSNNPYKNLSSHNKVRVNKTVEGKPVKTELTKYLDSLKREQEKNNDWGKWKWLLLRHPYL